MVLDVELLYPLFVLGKVLLMHAMEIVMFCTTLQRRQNMHEWLHRDESSFQLPDNEYDAATEDRVEWDIVGYANSEKKRV